jgi:hypothetical protein
LAQALKIAAVPPRRSAGFKPYSADDRKKGPGDPMRHFCMQMEVGGRRVVHAAQASRNAGAAGCRGQRDRPGRNSGEIGEQ